MRVDNIARLLIITAVFRLIPAAMFLAACVLVTDAQAQSTNVPPPSRIFIRGAELEFLHLTNVFITRRLEQQVTAMFDVGTAHDDEGELLWFTWWENGVPPVLGETARVTNVYTFGQYRIFAFVSDGKEIVSAFSDFEVISPLQAIRLLQADLEISGFRMDVSKWRGLLKTAEAAIKRRHWGTASQALERFVKRVGQFDPTDVEGMRLKERWTDAAGDVRHAVRGFNGVTNPNPGGVFPGPAGVWVSVLYNGVAAGAGQ
jgi:hypothetical protein